ncbi:NAD-dependent protein deacylase [Desulfovulcanus sp.]
MIKDWQALAEQGARVWARCKFAVALTGAGISVPSGIPDFRSPGGLWSKYDPQTVCSDWALDNNPKGVWEFLLDAVQMFARAKPNAAHKALARLEERGLLQAIITQNIDNLHQEAGSKNVIEFHGSCQRFYCNQCNTEFDPRHALRLTHRDIPWKCHRCSGIIRPDVVFFGEQIPVQALVQSQDLADRADLLVIVGTSGEVAPANTLPYMVKRHGGKVIEVNLGQTGYAGLSDVRIDGPAEEVLPFMVDLMIN